MNQLSADSIAKVFLQEEMALQGSSRSQAGRGVPAWLNRSSAHSTLPCPAVPSVAPLIQCPALGKLWVSTELVWCCGLCSWELREGLSSLCSCCRCPQPHLALAKACGCLGGTKQGQDRGSPPCCGWPGTGVPSGTVQGYIKHISLPDLAPPNVPSCPMGINCLVSTELGDRAFLHSNSGPSPCLLLAFCLD